MGKKAAILWLAHWTVSSKCCKQKSKWIAAQFVSSIFKRKTKSEQPHANINTIVSALTIGAAPNLLARFAEELSISKNRWEEYIFSFWEEK